MSNFRTAFFSLSLTNSFHPLSSHWKQGGVYVFQLFDYYACSGFPIVIFAIFETIGVAWIYGELLC